MKSIQNLVARKEILFKPSIFGDSVDARCRFFVSLIVTMIVIAADHRCGVRSFPQGAPSDVCESFSPQRGHKALPSDERSSPFRFIASASRYSAKKPILVEIVSRDLLDTIIMFDENLEKSKKSKNDNDDDELENGGGDEHENEYEENFHDDENVKKNGIEKSFATFKGFIVQAIDPRTLTFLGHFVAGDGLALLPECSAVTHSDSRPKSSATLWWIPPKSGRTSGEIIFRATIVEQKQIYYQNMIAEVID